MRKLKLVKFFIVALFIANGISAQNLIEVTASNNIFTPSSISIEVGDTVRWTNIEGTHNVNGSFATFPSNPESFLSGSPAAGWVFEHVFTSAGSYDYRCDLHFSIGMIGDITVAAPSGEVEIENFNISKITLYPIPATNFVIVEIAESLLTSENLSIQIYDVTGKLVVNDDNINSSLIKYDSHNWSNSIYILNLMSDSKIIATKKIVLNNRLD